VITASIQLIFDCLVSLSYALVLAAEEYSCPLLRGRGKWKYLMFSKFHFGFYFLWKQIFGNVSCF